MDTNYGEKFKIVIAELMNLLKSIIKELYDEKLINFNENAISLIITLLDANNEDNLIWCLASVNEHWGKILKKDETFITIDFPSSIKASNLPLDTNILTCPFTCYNLISNSDKWADIDEIDWPVSDEDLECIWDKMRLLVRITCLYIHGLRKKFSSNPVQYDKLYDVYKTINLNAHAQNFQINLQ